MKTENQRAWFFVLPVLFLVAFNALVPIMTVVNYSVQETFGNNIFFWRPEPLKLLQFCVEYAQTNDGQAELHLQVIKHSDVLQSVTGKEFCEALGIGASFGTDFAKMKKIAPRLKAAGLDVAKLQVRIRPKMT